MIWFNVVFFATNVAMWLYIGKAIRKADPILKEAELAYEEALERHTRASEMFDKSKEMNAATILLIKSTRDQTDSSVH